MNRTMKTLIVCLAVGLAIVMAGSHVIAQVGYGFHPLWEFPAFSSQPLQVPTWEDPFKGEGDILVDNFEYWDSPYNHGWRQAEPAYPVYGFGMGYATIFNTILDLQQGSRVLDVYRPASVFLLSTPYEKHAILYNLFTPPSAENPDAATGIGMMMNRVVSFDFRAPLGIEPWDIFELDVIGAADPNLSDNLITVKLLPIQPPAGSIISPMNNSTMGMYGIMAGVTGYNPAGQIEVTVSLGRGLIDGSWHAVWVDLAHAVKTAVDDFDDIATADKAKWYIARANALLVSGQMFRLDNIMFREYHPHAAMHEHIMQPDFFEMGPLYAQIFEPYTYLFMAEYSMAMGGIKVTDLMLSPDNFLLVEDPNDSNDPVVKYWTDLGADPNLFGQNDPNMAELFDKTTFVVDLALPIFADTNLRMTASGPSAAVKAGIIDGGTLGWNATVNGYGANGIQAFLLQPLPIYPYNGMPTYIPSYHDALDVVKAYGKPFFRPELVYLLEGALWNAGVEIWPMIVALNYTPQYFEDLIVTIEVTNGVYSDVRTFPISVVNYPVENYPPVIQIPIHDQIFYVGETGEYIMSFLDPDCFIFSLSPAPATTHIPGFPINPSFRTDMDGMVWNMTINGLTSYQYGPWIEQIIQPCSGLISWVPKFEGAYDTIVTCTDARGAIGSGNITIFTINRGTWLNHPPVILHMPTHPLVIKAGEEYIVNAHNLMVEDPDGDELYASCNIGTCGRAPDGSFIWKFQSNFPGMYMVEIVFYDIRGGYAILHMHMHVKPWWTY